MPIDRNAVGVQMEGVVDAKLTISPEDAVAANTGDVPNLWLPGFTNAMLCAAAVTENDCDTGSAAA